MEKTIEKIITYFEENEDVFDACIEELDSYNGYLGDGRYYYMEDLNEFYNGSDAIELLNRAYFGRDDGNWYTNERGEKIYYSFNPNREYFYYNGYGNLVSSDYKDYSCHLDEYAINSMSENRRYIDTIEEYEDLAALFDELEKED
jgi:hypothetical protein